MASLPDMHVYSPADPHETRLCLRHLVQHPRPSYLRLGKAGEPELHKVDGIASGPLRVREGRDGPAIVTTGSCLSIALETADRMSEEIASPSVYSCPLLSEPSGFYSPLWQHSDIITVEEHTAIGGLGDLLRRVAPVGITIKSLSLSGELAAESGSQRSLWTKHGITVSNLTDLIRRRQP